MLPNKIHSRNHTLNQSMNDGGFGLLQEVEEFNCGQSSDGR